MNHKNGNKQALLKCLEDCREIIVFDTETTGLDHEKDQIIQFSGLKVEVFKENGIYKYREIATIDEYIKPRQPVSDKIEQLTSITNDFLADKQSEEEAFEKIKAFFGEAPVISGYNVPFDIRMVKGLYMRQYEAFNYKESLDVLVYARDLVSRSDLMEATGEDSFKQEKVATVYGLNEGVSFHLAIEDARVTLKLLFIFINEFMGEEDKEKKKLTVKRVVYKEGHSHDRNGAYVSTDGIPLFYSYKYKQWYPTKKENLPAFEEIDLDAIESDVLKKTGLSSIEELPRYKGDTSSKAGDEGSEAVCRISGVNLWEKYGKKRIYVKGMSEAGKWFNCFYDVPSASWSCVPFTSNSIEKLVLTTTGQENMPKVVKSLEKAS